MTKRVLQDLRVLQQPTAEHRQLVSYAQPQHWPNQEPPAQPEPEDDDLEDDDLDPEEPLDEPGEEVEASRAEPSDALNAERRKTNQLERELRTIKRQLAQFSKIDPYKYMRLQEAERQKEQLEREIASGELLLAAAAARKVKAAPKERDEALQDVQNLRKERLLERLFVDADGRGGGDNRGSFFEIFKHQVGSEFRLNKDGACRESSRSAPIRCSVSCSTSAVA